MPDIGTSRTAFTEFTYTQDATQNIGPNQLRNSNPHIFARWTVTKESAAPLQKKFLIPNEALSAIIQRTGGSGNISFALVQSLDNGITWTERFAADNSSTTERIEENQNVISDFPETITDFALLGYGNFADSLGTIKFMDMQMHLVVPRGLKVTRIK